MKAHVATVALTLMAFTIGLSSSISAGQPTGNTTVTASTTAGIVPLPDCLPCDKKPPVIAPVMGLAAGIVPLPDCLPCDKKPPVIDIAVISPAGGIVPLPDCLPCDKKPPKE